MNDVFIKALAERVKAGQMTIEQVPIPCQDAVLQEVRGDDNVGY